DAAPRGFLERFARWQLFGVADSGATQHLDLQFLDALIDQLAWQLERIALVERFEHLAAQILADRLAELALHVRAHFATQALEVAVSDSEALREFFVERRGDLFF